MLFHLIVDAIVGAAVGFLGGLFGIGGGLIAIPILGIAYGMDEQHAQGTAMVMVVPNVLLGLYQYAKRDRMDLRIALALALSAVPCTFLAARIATSVPSTPLRIGFASFLLALAAYFAWRAFQPKAVGPAEPPRLERWPLAIPIGAIGGVLSGFFSVGGAVFAVAFMVLVFRFGQAVAQGYGLALVAPGTLVGVGTYAFAGDVVWPTGLAMAVGGVLAVSPGVALAHRLPERVMRLGFCGLCGLSALGLLLRA